MDWMTDERRTITGNNRFAYSGVSCFYDSEVLNPSFLYLMKFSDENPNCSYFKNLGISYPNIHDIENAKRLGKPTGGDINIHGLRNNTGFIGKFHRWFDWTLGCIAVTDCEIDELYKAVKIGTPIDIKP